MPLRAKLGRLLTGLSVCTAVAAAGIGAVSADRAGDRTISLYNIHTKETVTVLYKRDGRYVSAAMEKINWVLRDWRKNAPTTMDPALIDTLWEIHTELGSQSPIHIISGYRSPGTNAMLKRTRGGQAEKSQHINGKAADVHFPDVPIQRLRYSALVRERGGVGYYPTSAIPFVHVDTARVRAWPRLPRSELALLFPSGRTQHMPADGGPLTAEDGRAARVRLASAGGEMAAFLDIRRGGTPTRVAVATAPPKPPQRQPVVSVRAPAQSAWNAEITPQPALAPLPPTLFEAPRVVASGPASVEPSKDRKKLHELATLASLAPEPRLLSAPKPAARPQPPLASLSGQPGPVGTEAVEGSARAGGHQVAAIDAAGWTSPGPRLNQDGLAQEPMPTGRFGWGATGHELRWVPATEFDDEHPDELSYRPFAIAPLFTDSAEEPLLASLVPHDVARTLEMIDQPVSRLPLHFRPSAQVAAKMWSQQFTGGAVGLDRLMEPATATGTGGMRQRAVQTSSR